MEVSVESGHVLVVSKLHVEDNPNLIYVEVQHPDFFDVIEQRNLKHYEKKK